jgi:PST family polysaccharide transporter
MLWSGSRPTAPRPERVQERSHQNSFTDVNREGRLAIGSVGSSCPGAGGFPGIGRFLVLRMRPTLSLKTVAKNAGWLGLVQALSYVLPLATVPVVARAFGPSLYGVLASFYASAAYVGILTEFGFNSTGPRAIAAERSQLAQMSGTVSAIATAQILLGFVGAIAFALGLSVISFGTDYRIVGLIVLTQSFATALAPQWVYLGLEQMRNFALIQLTFRTLAAVLVVIMIRSPADLVLYAGINCAAAIAVLVLSLVGLTQYDLRWRAPSPGDVVLVIRQGSRLFVSNLAISLYTTSSVLVVALMLGPGAAGAFALADRIRQATAGMIYPISQAVYPFACRLAAGAASEGDMRTQRFVFRGIVVLSSFISLALFAGAPLITWLAGGNAFDAAVPVLRIMAVLPVIIALSNTFGRQTMLPLRMDREFTWVVTSAALFGLSGLFLMAYDFGLPGAALAMVAAELYVGVALAMMVRRRMSIFSLFFKYP